MTTFKVDGVHRKIVGAFFKENGVWRKGTEIFSKENNVWKTGWKNNFPTPSFVSIPSSITRGQTITWSCEDIPGADYEYQRKYDNESWGESSFFSGPTGQVTISTATDNNSFQIRIRAVDPVTHDKESNWAYSAVRSLNAQTLSNPDISYTTNITRGQKVRVSWTNESNAITYELQTIYTKSDGSKAYYTIHDGSGISYKDDSLSDSTTNDKVQFRIRASRPGYISSDWVTGPLVTLKFQQLAAPDWIKSPDPYEGQTITVSWAKVSKTQKYELEVQFDNGSWSRVYTGPNTSVTYKVAAKDSIDWRVRATASEYLDSDWCDGDQYNIGLPPLKETTWTAKDIGSWRPNFGGQWHTTATGADGDYLYQGAWDDGFNWGGYTGMAFFDYSSIRNTLDNKRIEKVQIYLYRINAGGYATGKAINLHTHNYASKPNESSGRPSMSHLQGPFSSFARGEGKWVTVDKDLITRILNGSARGFGLYRGTDPQGYMYFSNNVKLKVTYR